MKRCNAKKIAKIPSLKRRIARFCADYYSKYDNSGFVLEEILFSGHRGFVSFAEDDLGKTFDKCYEAMRPMYEEVVKRKQEDSKKRWSRQSDSDAQIELFYEEATSIANEIFEDTLLR